MKKPQIEIENVAKVTLKCGLKASLVNCQKTVRRFSVSSGQLFQGLRPNLIEICGSKSKLIFVTCII